MTRDQVVNIHMMVGTIAIAGFCLGILFGMYLQGHP